ncbi:hypothetical protein B0O80DRAFT_472489 [Mortierella sp. GBAus27b]|nr:hypothetical protein B0O80DRAFT_472489 [Mortierella sp. GBAus27b]
MAARKAMGEKALGSGVESMTLVSRGDEDTGSSHSLKARSVQEQVFSEIKAMVSRFEAKYGDDKLQPIPPRSQQSEDMDKIVESFRKLREGLFATEARDMFAAEVYEQSVLFSLRAGNIPELTKALSHLIQEVHPVVYGTGSNTSSNLVTIPAPRQRFLGLYILFYIAKPNRPRIISEGASQNESFSQTINHLKTETDELVASLLYVYELHRRGSPSGLEPDLLFVLAYWKSLRDGTWIHRERLLEQRQTESSGRDSISWDQQLMIRHSTGNPLGAARTITVAAMSKAYYSLPITAMAQAVGLVEQRSAGSSTHPDTATIDQWCKKLQASYGLSPNIVVRDGSLMFKLKS